MKPVLTRRTWRQLYRRSRLYLPLVVLLLLAMAIYLPLSPPWLTGAVERKIREESGLPISIDRVRVRLWTADVHLFGVELQGTGGELPFRLESMHLSGAMSELLAGDGHWPEEVVLAGPSPMHVVVSATQKLEPGGPLQTLMNAVSGVGANLESNRENHPSKGSRRKQTPRIIAQNVILSVESEREGVPDGRLDLREIEIASRSGASEPLQFIYRGVVTSGGSERISGEGVWVPEANRLEVRSRADAVAHTLMVPQLGGFDVDAEGMRLQISATHQEDGDYEVVVRAGADRFSVEETRLNGERWTDEELHFRVRAEYDPVLQAFKDISARLDSSQIDMRLSGSVEAKDDLESDLRLEVVQVPPLTFAILRRAARGEGFDVDETTSPSLTLDLVATGPLKKTDLLRIDGGIEARDWRIVAPDVPSPIDVRHLRGRIEDNVLNLSVMDIGCGEMNLTGSLHGRIPSRNRGTEPFETRISIDAPAQEVIKTLRSFDVSTSPVIDIRTNISFRVEGTMPVEMTPDGIRILVREQSASWDANIAWTEGSLQIENLADPVGFTPGRLSASPLAARLSGLRLKWADVVADIEGTALSEDGSILAGFPLVKMRAACESPVPSMMRLVSHYVHLPFPADRFGGTARFNLQTTTPLNDIASSLWNASLEFESASGHFDVPYSEVRVTNLDARIDATSSRLDVSRFSAIIQDEATVEGSASIAKDGVIANVEIASPLHVVPDVLPKELKDFVIDGTGAATAEVRLKPLTALPEGRDIYSQYVAHLSNIDGPVIGVRNSAPLQLSIDGRIRPGDVAVFFHRDFPHPITNIRGNITADESGFQFQKARASFGEADDVEVTGWVTLGHVGTPRIEFTAEAPELDINEWLHGWGSMPWSENPFVRPPRPRGPNEQRKLVEIAGNVKLGHTEFLSVRAENTDVDLRFESWRGRENTLDATLHDADTYDGQVRGTARVVFPRTHDRLSSFTTKLDASDVRMQPFMTDLRKKPSEFNGRFTGSAEFGGEIGDYSTWAGDGVFRVQNSGFIGRQTFNRLAVALNLGDRENLSATEINGTASLEDEVITFPDMVVESEDIQMLSPGTVNIMTGQIDFDLAVNVLDAAIDPIPFLSTVNRVFNELKNRIVRFRVHGKISEPEITTQTLNMDRESFFQTGRRALEGTSERLKRVEQRLGISRDDSTEMRDQP